MPDKAFVQTAIEVAPAMVVGFFAGIVNRMNKFMKGEKFNFAFWIVNGMMSSLLWMSVALVIEPGKIQLLVAIVCWICSNQIFDLIEKNGAGIIVEAFLRAFNLKKTDSDPKEPK